MNLDTNKRISNLFSTVTKSVNILLGQLCFRVMKPLFHKKKSIKPSFILMRQKTHLPPTPRAPPSPPPAPLKTTQFLSFYFFDLSISLHHFFVFMFFFLSISLQVFFFLVVLFRKINFKIFNYIILNLLNLNFLFFKTYLFIIHYFLH